MWVKGVVRGEEKWDEYSIMVREQWYTYNSIAMKGIKMKSPVANQGVGLGNEAGEKENHLIIKHESKNISGRT